MRDNSKSSIRSTKIYDVLVASPLVLFYGLSLAGLWPRFAAAFRVKPYWVSVLQVFSLASFALYLVMIVALVFLRRMPVAKSASPWPKALAIFSSTALFALPLLPAASLSPLLVALSAALLGGGTLAELVILAWLRRAFSLLPEARGLVMRGPYRWIRHPLYLAGLVTSLGAMMPFLQPWSFLIVVANFGLQLFRMHYEEEVLARSYPEYAAYVARTYRLIPGVY